MKTAVVTDGKYRASLAAVRALGEAGFSVVVTQTRQEAVHTPAPLFPSLPKRDGGWRDPAGMQTMGRD